MKKMSPDIESMLKDLGLRVLGAIGAVGLIVSLAFLGDLLNIGFLNSGGGLLIATIITGEVLFLGFLVYMVFTDRL